MSLYIYVVYDHPKDYPDHWVVKRDIISSVYPSCIGRDSQYVLVKNSLAEIKRHFESLGLYFLKRLPDDDPVIYGTYL
jgi:hypothetical protein